jgi:endo-1,3(4)-beta-glucanase
VRLRLPAVVVVAAVALFPVACTAGQSPSGASPGTSPGRTSPGDRPVVVPDGAPPADRTGRAPDVDPTILPAQELAPEPSMRLEDGLPPPTNRWFSGLVFGESPQPVFPRPLAFALTGTGFAYGLPEVTAQGAALLGSYAPQVTADVGEQVTGIVTAYDVASVTVELRDGGGSALGEVLLVEGSPVLRYRAAKDHALALGVPFGAGTHGLVSADVTGREHLLVGVAGLDVGSRLDEDGRRLRLGAGESVAWVPAPDDAGSGLDALATAAATPVSGTSLAFGVDDDAVTTAITYAPADGRPTAVVRLPHQRTSAGMECGLGTYRTVLGTAEVCTTTTAAWSVPTVEPVARLDLAGLTDAERAELAAQVRQDADRVVGPGAEPRPSDTYFGGKALARDANLHALADELGLDDVAASLRDDLAADLREWTEPDGCARRDARCFAWDARLGTVVGRTPAFGSEEANDHHFHYGYFLYAAGLVAADDAELATDLAPVLDLLAADVAAGAPVDVAEGAPLPALRVLDAYAGHSWASGYAPFADGNNQESSSEAVAAWQGLALWARARSAAGLPDVGLEAQATWLQSVEAASATAYWSGFDRSDPVHSGLDASVTSLVWGGKRERATWFSAEPSAALGIVVLPVTAASGYLVPEGDDGGAARIRDNLAEALGVGPGVLWDDPAAWDVLFGDQLLMYAGLAGPDDAAAALDVARGLPDERIDDGSTRSWLLAWLMSRG